MSSNNASKKKKTKAQRCNICEDWASTGGGHVCKGAKELREWGGNSSRSAQVNKKSGNKGDGNKSGGKK
ncbi:hypothetical protein CVT26_006174 [Gymnopilus dilepis]|uniref:Uncharacterized protein n=1 Tax=Gymnopilus dilepis TaxID=231916 RepID=A0A409Y1D4_9AGAR|nr:hypothetical protein CVT26_006174 [Gymnopilus dilepis]